MNLIDRARGIGYRYFPTGFSFLPILNYYSDQHWKTRYVFDFQPVSGRRSAKAERLVDFCLGEFKDKAIPPCTGDSDYLKDENILLFEADPKRVVLSSKIRHDDPDQKKVVEAFISQRAEIPSGLRCWLIRRDNSGAASIPEQGLHIAGMRAASRRHLVLVPTTNRERYLGPKLERQMGELRQAWVPWEEKSDTAWWGGALTGDQWATGEPRTLTRRELLYYFRDNPSDRVRLVPTEFPDSPTSPPGIALKENFTKQSAFGNKCLVLLPGNDIASGSSWYFAGNSVVLMPKPHLEHIFYFEMEPWEHYVPLENDPADVLAKLEWVLENQDEARQIINNSHDRLRWFCGPEYLWACNEVLRRIAPPVSNPSQAKDPVELTSRAVDLGYKYFSTAFSSLLNLKLPKRFLKRCYSLDYQPV